LGCRGVTLGKDDEGFMIHNGQTLGDETPIGCDPKSQILEVVLSNIINDHADLEYHILRN
jgi:hypothetical protein